MLDEVAHGVHSIFGSYEAKYVETIGGGDCVHSERLQLEDSGITERPS